MANSVTFNINGLDSVIEKLRMVSYDVKKKSGRAALRKAARFVVNDIKKRAESIDDPSTVRSIKKNVDLRWNNYVFKSTGDLAFRIGILGGASKYANTKLNRRKRRAGSEYEILGSKENPGGDTWYWRMWEFGTEKRAAHPFVRPALEENIATVTEIFITEYEKALDKALAQVNQ